MHEVCYYLRFRHPLRPWNVWYLFTSATDEHIGLSHLTGKEWREVGESWPGDIREDWSALGLCQMVYINKHGIFTLGRSCQEERVILFWGTQST